MYTPTHISLARFSPIHFLTLRAFPSSQTTQTRCWGRLGILFFFAFSSALLLPSDFSFFFFSSCYPSRLSFHSPAPTLYLLKPRRRRKQARNSLSCYREFSLCFFPPFMLLRRLWVCRVGAPTLNWKIHDTTKAAQEKGSKKKVWMGHERTSRIRAAAEGGGRQAKSNHTKAAAEEEESSDNIEKIFRCHLTASFFSTVEI